MTDSPEINDWTSKRYLNLKLYIRPAKFWTKFVFYWCLHFHETAINRYRCGVAWGFDQFQSHAMVGLLLLLLIIFIVIRVLKNSEAVGHWNHLFPEMKHDPEEFYALVEELLNEREIPDITTTRRTLKEAGMLSHQRLYLEVSRGDYIFHLCAAPWGSGFFFSWWVRQRVTGIDEVLILIPYFGPRIVKLRQYQSYYKLDTDAMFRKSVHQSVLEAIDRLTTAKGIRGLSELERQPNQRSVIKNE